MFVPKHAVKETSRNYWTHFIHNKIWFWKMKNDHLKYFLFHKQNFNCIIKLSSLHVHDSFVFFLQDIGGLFQWKKRSTEDGELQQYGSQGRNSNGSAAQTTINFWRLMWRHLHPYQVYWKNITLKYICVISCTCEWVCLCMGMCVCFFVCAFSPKIILHFLKAIILRHWCRHKEHFEVMVEDWK